MCLKQKKFKLNSDERNNERYYSDSEDDVDTKMSEVKQKLCTKREQLVQNMFPSRLSSSSSSGLGDIGKIGFNAGKC
jgi:hypothetical protein